MRSSSLNIGRVVSSADNRRAPSFAYPPSPFQVSVIMSDFSLLLSIPFRPCATPRSAMFCTASGNRSFQYLCPAWTMSDSSKPHGQTSLQPLVRLLEEAAFSRPEPKSTCGD